MRSEQKELAVRALAECVAAGLNPDLSWEELPEAAKAAFQKHKLILITEWGTDEVIEALFRTPPPPGETQIPPTHGS